MEIHNDNKKICGGVKNILVRQFAAQIWPVLMSGASGRKLQTLKSWQNWSLCRMLGTKLAITTGASLGHESLSFRTSCIGLRTLRAKLYIG